MPSAAISLRYGGPHGSFRQAALTGPEQVLEYVGGYTHRVAISNNRLRDTDDGKVRFTWKDYRPAEAIASVPEWGRRFRLVRVDHEYREELGRLRFAGIGDDAVAVTGNSEKLCPASYVVTGPSLTWLRIEPSSTVA